ncbi:MAG: ABC transporter permease [Bacteroidetes bacterium GWF2_38_335]|nr:MAG: ABC transporter permease [Bacteroidetes bacterium GWF2_38_335]OFY80323.1 MAG: ABC transporter permease [Bacteroidetes bacterium RIFOXYA12_FULL_38_20]HBS88877.1 ABC transporter permease [Bacteroidales bacterium]
MNTTADILWIDLLIGQTMLIVPLIIFWYYKTGLILDTLIATVRMSVQLFLVGVYLKYVFEWNNPWINSAWVMIMVIVASLSISDRTKLKHRFFFIPNFIGVFISLLVVDAFLLGYIIQLDNVFDARYYIPITGMILGNSLQNNIISLNTFYKTLKDNLPEYHFALAGGAKKSEALFPYMREALINSFNPTIARMAVIGLIALPGTMTGQIIGGSSPEMAIKYQIMLMIAIFSSSVISVFLSIWVSMKIVFDRYQNLNLGIFREKRKK